MVDASAAVEKKQAELAAAYPGWRVWLSRRGKLWMATRIRGLSERDMYEGLHRTLVCENAEELSARLAEQAETERAMAGRRVETR
jgi:hypothetical protein